MDERVHVTEDGLVALQAEYDDLINNRRPAIIRTVALAREEGDLRENSGYHAARHDQTLIEGRIRQLEDESLADAEALVEADPFREAGVFQSWEMKPWRQVM